MIFSDAPISAAGQVAGWMGLLAGGGWAIRRAPWKQLQAPGLLNVWLGTVVALALIWQMRAQAAPGLHLHFLGVMLLLLEVGPHLAFLGVLSILLLVTANAAWQGSGAWEVFGLNGLLLGLLPVVLGWTWVRLVRRFAPRHLFVFIFANGFFGSGVTVVVAGVFTGLVLTLFGSYSPRLLAENYWPYLGLVGFAEAWLTGMVVTLIVVYRPRWLFAFDENGYFGSR